MKIVIPAIKPIGSHADFAEFIEGATEDLGVEVGRILALLGAIQLEVERPPVEPPGVANVRVVFDPARDAEMRRLTAAAFDLSQKIVMLRAFISELAEVEASPHDNLDFSATGQGC